MKLKEISPTADSIDTKDMGQGTKLLKGGYALAPNQEFKDAQKDSLSALAILDVATMAISVQPDFKNLKGVDNLIAHQKASKINASKWRDEVRGSLLGVNDAIINYSIDFNNLYKDLYAFAEQLSDQDPGKCKEAQINLVYGLKELKGQLKQQQIRVIHAKTQVSELQESLLKNERDLKSDLIEIEAKFKGDKGKIADIKKQIAAYEKAMSKDLTIIGISAGTAIVGGLIIVVGVVATVSTAGSATPVIITGAVIAAGGTGAGIYGIVSYNKSSNKKSNALAELTKIDSEIAIATTLKSGVSTLVNHLDSATQALDDLSKGWGVLVRDCENLIGKLTDTQGAAEKTKPISFIVKSHLRSSNDLWSELLNDAKMVKKNLLSPIEVDKSPIVNPKAKNPLNLQEFQAAENNLKAARVILANTFPSVTMPQLKETGFKLWIDNISKTVFSFEEELSNLIQKGTAPNKLKEADQNLLSVAIPTYDKVNKFIISTGSLSNESVKLKETAKLEGTDLVQQAAIVFKEVAEKIDKAQEYGQIASDSVSKLENCVFKVDAALSEWITEMKADKEGDQQKLLDVIRIRDKEIREREDLKNNYWYCVLGAVACAIAIIAINSKVDKAQSEINAYNSKLSNMDKALSDLLNTIKESNSMSSKAQVLAKSIDGGLTAVQVIKATIEGIDAHIDNLPSFIIKAHLNAVAEQIEGVSDLRLRSINKRLLQIMSTEQNVSIVEDLRELTSATIMAQSSAMICAKQPRLNNVQVLLKQNQALLQEHSLEWITKYANNVLSEISGLRALGNGIHFLGKEILDLANKGNVDMAHAGIDNLIESISGFMDNRMTHDKISLQLFNEKIKDDRIKFNTVSKEIRTKYEGEAGELVRLAANEKAYASKISQSLTDIVNNSTRVICEHLVWGVVLAVSIGAGQFQFTGVAGATVMNLVKTGANFAIKKATDKGASLAKSELLKFNEKGGDIGTLINERAANLEKLHKLSKEMTILKVLENDASIMKTSAARILKALDAIHAKLTIQIHDLYLIKITLQGAKPSKGIDNLKTFSKKWEDISKTCNLLEQTFLGSLTK